MIKLKKRVFLTYVASDFAFYEESFIIYGLPFGNTHFIQQEIGSSVKDFVSKIIDISPCVYKNNDEMGNFFQGKLNGNWRVRVIPKVDVCVPNYISVGRIRVQGKVVYSNRANLRTQQCANCFSENHLRNDALCPGVKEWREYCAEFEEKKRVARESPTIMEETDARETESVWENRMEEHSSEEMMKMMTEVTEAKEEIGQLKRKILLLESGDKERDEAIEVMGELHDAKEENGKLGDKIKELEDACKQYEEQMKTLENEALTQSRSDNAHLKRHVEALEGEISKVEEEKKSIAKSFEKKLEVVVNEQKNRNEENLRVISDLEAELAEVKEKFKSKEIEGKKESVVEESDGKDSESIKTKDDKGEEFPKEGNIDERNTVMDVSEETAKNEDDGLEKLRDEEKVEGASTISIEDDASKENNGKRERSPNDEAVNKINLKSKIIKWIQWDGDGNYIAAKIRKADEVNERTSLLDMPLPAPPRPPRSRSSSLSRSQGRLTLSHPLEVGLTPPGSPAHSPRRRAGSMSGVDDRTGREKGGGTGSGTGAGTVVKIVPIKENLSGTIVGFNKETGEWLTTENC